MAPKRPRSSPKAGDDADTAAHGGETVSGNRFLVDVNSTGSTVSLLQGIEAKLHGARDEVHGLIARQDASVEAAPAVLVRELASIAHQLLQQSAIVAKASDGTTTVFLLRELELYCHYPNVHPDSFTHCDEQQTRFGTWYFHKKGGTYKSGSFKGLDITAGFERPTKPVAGAGSENDDSPPIPAIGFLIRSIQRLAERPGDAATPEGLRAFGFGSKLAAEGLVEGPSLTVDALLAATGSKTISGLVGSAGHLLISSALGSTNTAEPRKLGPDLYLVSARAVDAEQGTTRSPKVLAAPRVGLIPRTVPHLTFAGRLYRYISSWPDNNKSRHLSKHRSGIVSALAAAELQRLSANGSIPDSLSGQKRTAVLESLRENSGATKQNCEAILDLVSKSWNALIVGRKDVGTECGRILGEDVHKSEIIAPIVVAALSLDSK